MDTFTYYSMSSALYLSLLAAVGFWTKTGRMDKDPHLGGRSMGFWTTALSAHASDMSAWLFLSLPMLIWTQGASQIWVAIGLWIGMALNWLIVSKRLRIKTAAANCSTLPAWFHYAFSDKYGVLRSLCAGLSSLFLLHYIAAGLIAIGLLTEEIFGIDYSLGNAVAMALIAGYTMKGGFNAVAWVDLFQALFLLSAIMMVPVIAYQNIPDGTSILTLAKEQSIALAPWNFTSQHEAWQSLFNALGWGLGYFGMPHILSKFMGIREAKEIRKSMAVGLIWHFLALASSVAIGIVALGHMRLLSSVKSELIFIELVRSLTHPSVAGLIFCAMMAATLSTMDSQLLVTASVLEEDLLRKYLNKKSKATRLKFFRLAILGLSLVAWFISLTRSPSVQATVLYSWSGLGACYGPLVLWSLYAKPSHWLSGCLAVIASALGVSCWQGIEAYLTTTFLGETYSIPPLVPGFMLGLATLSFTELILRKLLKQKRSIKLST